MSSYGSRFAVLLAAASLIFSVAVCAQDDKAAQTPATQEKATPATEPAPPPPTRPRRARSTWAANTLPTRPSPAPSPWARPMRRMRNWAWTESRSREASSRSPSPRNRRTRRRWRGCSTWRTSRRTRRPRIGPSRSSITAVRAAPRCGCTWDRWDRSTW